MKYSSTRVLGPVLVIGIILGIAAFGPSMWHSGPDPVDPPPVTVVDPVSLAAESAVTPTQPLATTQVLRFTTTTGTTLPTFVETALGTMVVSETTFSVGYTDATLSNPVVTPDGFALMATAGRDVELWTSTSGDEWAREPVPDIFGEYPWIYQLIASGDSLLAIGRGDYRPQAWLRTPGGSWLDIDIYASMAFEGELLDWYYLDAFGSPTPDGEFALVGGAIAYVDWSAIISEWGHHGFEWDDGARQLVAFTDDGERRFDLDVQPEPVGAWVSVRDASSGDVTYEGHVVVPGLSPEQTVDALLVGGGIQVSMATVTLRLGRDGAVEKGVGIDLAVDVITGFAANDRSSVVLGMDWVSGPTPQSQVLVGPIDGPWVDVTAAFDLSDGSTVDDVVARPGQFLVTGTHWGKIEISPSVFVTGPTTVMWLSDDGSPWTELPAFSAPVGPGQLIVGGGGLGWAAATDSCMGECTRSIWVSRDGDEWDEVPLTGEAGRSFSMHVSGLAVGIDRVIAVAWSDTGESGDGFNAVITVISMAG